MTFISDAEQPVSELIVVGDIMVDTFARIDHPLAIGLDNFGAVTRRVGGQAANTSAWLAWLGARVNLIATCGEDSDGQWVRSRLQAAGVTHHRVGSADGPTGRCVVVVDPDGARTMISDPGVNRHLAGLNTRAWSALWRTMPSRVDTHVHDYPPRVHLHLSGYLQHHSPELPLIIVRSARDRWPSITASFDASAASPTPAIRQAFVALLPEIDLVFATSEELANLLSPGRTTPPQAPLDDDPDALIDQWRSSTQFTGTVVLKLGALGVIGDSVTGDGGSERVRIAAPRTDVVDTTGAGDAFAAGFLAAWDFGQRNLSEALMAGTESASRAISHIGAGPPTAEGR